MRGNALKTAALRGLLGRRAAVDLDVALRARADMLELDVGVTRDEKVVVMHDTTVDGKTNGHGTVASKTLRQIRRLGAA